SQPDTVDTSREPSDPDDGPATVPYERPSAATPAPAPAAGALPEGRARFEWVARLGIQAAEALEHAHTLGGVHRDVKPGNLMLDPQGNVWLTDFGLARLGAGPGVTGSRDVVGTLRYMSPEQALAKHDLVDQRSDVYSLGATLYEMLTGRPVVDGGDDQEV